MFHQLNLWFIAKREGFFILILQTTRGEEIFHKLMNAGKLVTIHLDANFGKKCKNISTRQLPSVAVEPTQEWLVGLLNRLSSI